MVKKEPRVLSDRGTLLFVIEWEKHVAANKQTRRVGLTVFVLATALSLTPGWAKGRGGNWEHHAHRGAVRSEEHGRGHFSAHDRAEARAYYGAAERRGHCPPGLAKKRNGCLPPGLARKWVLGRPLPAGVAYAPVPPALVVHLTPPPVGYRYVRVANDILMIAAGTNMVVDAIQDLGSR